MTNTVKNMNLEALVDTQMVDFGRALKEITLVKYTMSVMTNAVLEAVKEVSNDEVNVYTTIAREGAFNDGFKIMLQKSNVKNKNYDQIASDWEAYLKKCFNIEAKIDIYKEEVDICIQNPIFYMLQKEAK